jgi:ABC-type phosphate transport system substrate-binding protein
MPKIRVVFAALALVLGADRLSAQGYVVVVNAANPTTSLNKEKANNIFLKRVARWEDGSAVMPINLNGSSPTRDAFSRVVHGKKASLIEVFWQQQIFAGKEAPPVERSADAEVLAFVRANPGAIGYVSAATPLGSEVKAITIN